MNGQTDAEFVKGVIDDLLARAKSAEREVDKLRPKAAAFDLIAKWSPGVADLAMDELRREGGK